eukprot:jgi/Phyca11/101153/e_gw1.5.1122.1
MQGCFAPLLCVISALERSLQTSAARIQNFLSRLLLNDPNFLSDLTTAEEVIDPLSHASFKLQRVENTLADVVRPYQEDLWGIWTMWSLPSSCDDEFVTPTSSLRKNLYGIYYYRNLIGIEDIGASADEMYRWKHGLFCHNPSLLTFQW